MQFSYTIVYVKDVPQTVDFYQKAFGLEPRFIHESERYAEMETGRTALAVQAAFARAVDAGATPVAEPQFKPWGQTVAYAQDLDGVLIEICSPL